MEKHFTLLSHRNSFLFKDIFPFGNRNSSGHFVFQLEWYWEPFAREDDWRPVLLPLALGGRKHLGLSDLRKSPSIKILVLVSSIHYQTASHQSCIAWCQYNYQNEGVSNLPHANTKIILYWSQKSRQFIIRPKSTFTFASHIDIKNATTFNAKVLLKAKPMNSSSFSGKPNFKTRQKLFTCRCD